MTKEVLAIALEALEMRCGIYDDERKPDGAITTIREALAQPVQPVPGPLEELRQMLQIEVDRLIAAPLPVQRQPLTDEQIRQVLEGVFDSDDETFMNFARAIEAAHNIGGAKP